MEKNKKEKKEIKRRHSHSFFQEPPVVQITVTTTVNERQEDCVTGCFKAIFGCAKKSAT